MNEEEASEYYMAALARHDMYKKKEENLRKSFTTWENDKEAHTTKGNVRKCKQMQTMPCQGSGKTCMLFYMVGNLE